MSDGNMRKKQEEENVRDSIMAGLCEEEVMR